ncbi:hypothetical protein B0181_00840 [Moraxella caviae]|uniref:protein adenylyltransferase n=1 Tax=Moraxella caviae TaxID=34060 RepID=A0A1T0ABJ9_9GAMM|nr:Fic family protein [Moraxella caviae]OOR93060.1 hypothetical protein B0181_00840 [Moraxella caviae]STZ10034.1 Probable adenosine monophosphate-protein transferase fic [Moraxella caviae]VEW12775.1 Probable adenosine monophosphate-protein transferase fic [Moraxella caviae]VEW13225.1 Probable adenosine monophosphate-protein transferase fic [Moraxella caviae]
MNDIKFGSAHSDEMIAQRYFYGEVGKSALINKLGITDQSALDRAEALFVNHALYHGLSAQAKTLSAQGLQAMHKELFGELYEWAGSFRDYSTGRGLPFCRPEFIAKELDKLYQHLNDNLHQNLSKSRFVQLSAKFIGELNAIHPFIDGNGRTQRESLLIITQTTGFQITLNAHTTTYLSQEKWYAAAEESHYCATYHGFEEIIDHIIK